MIGWIQSSQRPTAKRLVQQPSQTESSLGSKVPPWLSHADSIQRAGEGEGHSRERLIPITDEGYERQLVVSARWEASEWISGTRRRAWESWGLYMYQHRQADTCDTYLVDGRMTTYYTTVTKWSMWSRNRTRATSVFGSLPIYGKYARARVSESLSCMP